MDTAPRIAPLARADVQRLAGAQVVPDLRAAIKELVENALDAGATSIGACRAPPLTQRCGARTTAWMPSRSSIMAQASRRRIFLQ